MRTSSYPILLGGFNQTELNKYNCQQKNPCLLLAIRFIINFKFQTLAF